MSNPALHARSSVEVFFGVGYMNDNMYSLDTVKSPYGFSPTSNWYCDGDIATIKADSSTEYNAVVPDTLIASSYPKVLIRAKVEPDSSYMFGVYYTDYTYEYSSLLSNTEWETHSIYLSGGDKTILSFSIIADGTVYVDYGAICDSFIRINPMEMTVTRAITDEVDSAEITLDYLEYKNYDFLGSHIKIWLAKDTIITSSSFKKVFSGIVEHITKNIEGHSPRNIELVANGYGSYLKKKIFRVGKALSGTADSVVRGIVDDLVKEGKITTHHVYPTTETFFYTARQNKYVSDALEEIADKYDYDFYVDPAGDLHFFKRGSLESDKNIDVDETAEFPYEEDLESVINYQQVIGADVGTIGSDLEWSDKLDNWSSNGDLSLDNKVVYSDAEGTVSIRSSLASGGTIWFERTLDEDERDLSLGGVLTYALQLKAILPSASSPPKIRTKNSFISPTGTFSVTVESSGGLKAKRSLGRYDGIEVPEYVSEGNVYWYYPFAVFEVPFNYKARTRPETIGATIDWTNIGTIRVEILSPVSSSTVVAWIDNFYITDVYISTIKTDNTSIQKYGVREGIPIGPDPSLDTYDKIDAIGSIMIDVYKDPIKAATDVKTLRGFDFEPGYEYTISLKEFTVPLILRSIRYEVGGMDFTTYLSFSKRHIPSPEKLLAITKKQLQAFGWDIEAWKNARQPTNVIPTRSEQIEFWETDLEFPRAALVSSLFSVSLGDSLDNYNRVFETYMETIEVGSGGYYRMKVVNSADTEPRLESRVKTLKANNRIQFRCKVVPDLMNCTSSESRGIAIGIYDPAIESGYHFQFVPTPGSSLDGTILFWAGSSSLVVDTFVSKNTYDCWAIINPDKGIQVFLNEEYKGSLNNILSGTFLPFVFSAWASGTSGNSIQAEIIGYQVAQAW